MYIQHITFSYILEFKNTKCLPTDHSPTCNLVISLQQTSNEFSHMQKNDISYHRKPKKLLVYPPIPWLFTMSSNKSYIITSNKEWRNPGKYRPSHIIITNKIIWMNGNYALFQDMHIKNKHLLPSRQCQVLGYPELVKISRYKSIKITNCIKEFLNIQQSSLLLGQRTILPHPTQEMEDYMHRASSKSPLQKWVFYSKDIIHSTGKFCHAKFKEDDDRPGGMLNWSVILNKLAIIEIIKRILHIDNCEQQNIPIPKCLWFHRFRSGYFDLALKHLNETPLAPTHSIIKWYKINLNATNSIEHC